MTGSWDPYHYPWSGVVAKTPLYEAGCDDALVGRNGEGPVIAFTREALSRSDAVQSAIADAESVSGVRVL